jgi:hypothetical protein
MIKLSVACLLIIFGNSSEARANFIFTTIDYPDAGETFVTGINNNGEMVGWYHDAAGDHGFLRSSDGLTFTTFDNPAAIGGTSIQGINNSGYLTGSFFNSTTNGTSFLLRSDGSGLINFDDPNASGPTYAHGINDNAQIVGHFSGGSSDVHGFLRNADGSFITLDDPSAPVGTIGTHGTVARGINNVGEIVGYVPGLNGLGDIGFLRDSDGSVYTAIVVPNSKNVTVPTDINNNGSIVGYFGDLDSATLGFVRSNIGVFSIFEVPDAAHGNTFAQGINDAGEIVGYFANVSGYHGFLATPCNTGSPGCVSYTPPIQPPSVPPNPPNVPELSSVLLLGTGLGAFAFLARAHRAARLNPTEALRYE